MMEVVAIRDISAREEVTITCTFNDARYSVHPFRLDSDACVDIEDGLSSTDRKSVLAAMHFECRCSLCTAPRDEILASDQNRQRIQEILGSLDSIRKDHAAIDLKDVQALAGEMLSLGSAEELGPSTIKRYKHDLMRIFYELGGISSAIKYAKGALTLSEEFDGPEDVDGLQRALRRNIEVLSVGR